MVGSFLFFKRVLAMSSKIVKVLKVASRKVKELKIIVESGLLSYFDGDIRIDYFCEGITPAQQFRSVLELELSESCIGDSIGTPNRGTEFLAAELSQKLSYVVRACDTESTRYALGGVNWEDSHLVATDGRRMHFLPIGLAEDIVNEKRSRIIPKKTIEVILSAIKEFQADIVKVYFEKNSVIVSGDTWKITALLTEGRFPAWRQVIPDQSQLERSENPIFVKQFAETLSAIIKRKKLEEKAHLSTLGKSERKRYRGENGTPTITIGGMIFNAEYVLDAVSNVRETTFYPKLNKNSSGASIVGNAVIMPLSK
jgi:DNA polymerase III sliding clamp (beta) subunit (PCNA family)